ncbi:MAG: site-specific integrase, partial [Planctomycetes bacterium]|nr:site-specific integrase [Planctomycetota bacterium]
VGKQWNNTTLLKAAKANWKSAELPARRIHEFRHTLATNASKYFPARMVQAAMGHLDSESADTYFHPDEEMASEVSQKIVSELFQTSLPNREKAEYEIIVDNDKNSPHKCPACQANLLILNKKTRKPL